MTPRRDPNDINWYEWPLLILVVFVGGFFAKKEEDPS